MLISVNIHSFGDSGFSGELECRLDIQSNWRNVYKMEEGKYWQGKKGL
jgi:hypothetical protein